MINIRHADLNDLPVLLKFEQDLIEVERPMDIDLRRDQIHYYDIKALIQSPKAAMMVAEENDLIVGCGYAKIQGSKSWHDHELHSYMGFMYTRPELRGKGINKLVMESLLQWSRSQDVLNIFLEVYDTNTSAIRAYEKVGFDKRLVEMRMKLD